MSNEEKREEMLENVRDLQNDLEQFENELNDLMRKGRNISRSMENYGGRVAQEGGLLNSYLINRLRSFLEGNEMFKFDDARETLEDEIEEIRAGVYDEEEVI